MSTASTPDNSRGHRGRLPGAAAALLLTVAACSGASSEQAFSPPAAASPQATVSAETGGQLDADADVQQISLRIEGFVKAAGIT